jgi:hypothetical protein
VDQATCGQKGSEWTRGQEYPAGIQSIGVTEGRNRERHTALGDYGGGSGECHACAVFRDRVRYITLPWVQALNKVLNFPPRISEYEARIEGRDDGWDLLERTRGSE